MAKKDTTKKGSRRSRRRSRKSDENKIIARYVQLVNSGKLTLSSVPAEYRSKVRRRVRNPEKDSRKNQRNEIKDLKQGARDKKREIKKAEREAKKATSPVSKLAQKIGEVTGRGALKASASGSLDSLRERSRNDQLRQISQGTTGFIGPRLPSQLSGQILSTSQFKQIERDAERKAKENLREEISTIRQEGKEERSNLRRGGNKPTSSGRQEPAPIASSQIGISQGSTPLGPRRPPVESEEGKPKNINLPGAQPIIDRPTSGVSTPSSGGQTSQTTRVSKPIEAAPEQVSEVSTAQRAIAGGGGLSGLGGGDEGGQTAAEFFSQRAELDPVFASLTEQKDFLKQQADLDPDEFADKILREARSEERAIKNVFNDLRRSQSIENKRLLGQNRAASARGGLLGSDFGAAQAQNTAAFGQQQLGAIANQEAVQIANVRDLALRRAETVRNNIQGLKSQGAEGFLAALEQERGAYDNALMNTLQEMQIKGVDINSLPAEEVNAIASAFKTTPSAVVVKNEELKRQQATLEQQNALFAAELAGARGIGASDELLSVAEAEKLGLPFGVTRNQAAQMGVVPGAEKEDGAVDDVTLKAITNTKEAANNALRTLAQIATDPQIASAIQQGAAARVLSAKVPGTPASNLQQVIKNLQALISFDALQDMRSASKTGGALGQVSERELDLLGSTVANLSIRLSPEILTDNLQYVAETFEAVSQAADADLASLTSSGSDFGGVGPSDAEFDF